uniref:Putative lipocalin-8 1 n=1 Tax=Amblyomma triste TaxID=251400 RepID=A0A023GA06_AMBTT
MIAITLVVLFSVLNLAACSSQTETPTLTPCPGETDPSVVIRNITFENVQLGKKLKIDADFEIKAPLDSDPVLYVYFSRPNGTQLDCPDYISNCELMLCDGTKIDEILLNREWNNQCPIPPGNYTAHVTVRILNGEYAEEFIGDGNLVVKFLIENGGKTADCVTFPVYVEKN